MSSLQLVESVPERYRRLLEEALSLPWDLQGELMVDLTSKASIKLPRPLTLELTSVIENARIMAEAVSLVASKGPAVNEDVRLAAHNLLRQPDGLTGPERALIAAVKLYHASKPEVSARAINLANNEAETVFISNITSTVGSAVKDGYLEEIKDPDENRSTFKVTQRGFTYFDLIAQRFPPFIHVPHHGGSSTPKAGNA